MIEQIINSIKNELSDTLNGDQMKRLSEVLFKHLSICLKDEHGKSSLNDSNLLSLFISAKRVEGCSEKSLQYYESTIRNMLKKIGKPECRISTEELRFCTAPQLSSSD